MSTWILDSELSTYSAYVLKAEIVQRGATGIFTYSATWIIQEHLHYA